MTKSLRISPDLSLPLDAVTKTFALLAVRGAGKSNAAAVMAEEMFRAGLPFVAIDPVGSWWGLRAGRDGKPGGGIAVAIFGGKRGDIPLERGAGELIADLVVEKRLSCVLDLSMFGSEADKKSFLLAFARRLYLKNEDPLHLFLEEADDYIPQSPMSDEKQLLRAWENIVRRGRSRGLGMTMITQRSAAIAKMVLTQVETLFALRTTGPQDIAAIEAWVKYHQVDKSLLASLSSLEDGDAWVWSPHYLKKTERIHFRQRETFDSGATPANVRGKDARPAATLADVDLKKIEGQIAATIQKAKQDDPKLLRKRVSELEGQLAKVATNTPPPVKIERVEVPMLSHEHVNKLSLLAERLQGAAGEAARAATAVLDAVREARSHERHVPVGGGRVERVPQRPLVATPRAPSKTLASKTSEKSLGAGERAVLIGVAQGPGGVTREQLTVLTGYKRSSRDSYLQRLGAAGMIERRGERIFATAEGFAELGDDFEPLPTGVALREHWLERLPEGESVILGILVQKYPEPLERSEFDTLTAYKRSSRDSYLQRLSARQLVESPSVGMVRASATLFGDRA